MPLRALPSLHVLCLLLTTRSEVAGQGALGLDARSAQVPIAYLLPFEGVLEFPAPVDSNSPAVWDSGELVVFNSSRHPVVSAGPDLLRLTVVGPVELTTEGGGSAWMEAVIRDENGTLYGYYHHEPPDVCPNPTLTAPDIRAARSVDGGLSWENLGVVITAPRNTANCDTPNLYFAGGVGDFSVALDDRGNYLYFFYSSYAGAAEEQGIAIARLPWEERDRPEGRVSNYYQGRWREPALGGRKTPIFPARSPWHEPDTDGFWGPSVHFNNYLQQYVMLVNHDVGQAFVNEGIYVSFSASLEDPESWSELQQLVEGGDWYPQVVGFGDEGTDKLAGRMAPFFMKGRCEWRIAFDKEPPAATSRAAGVTVAGPPAPLRLPATAVGRHGRKRRG